MCHRNPYSAPPDVRVASNHQDPKTLLAALRTLNVRFENEVLRADCHAPGTLDHVTGKPERRCGVCQPRSARWYYLGRLRFSFLSCSSRPLHCRGSQEDTRPLLCATGSSSGRPRGGSLTSGSRRAPREVAGSGTPEPVQRRAGAGVLQQSPRHGFAMRPGAVPAVG